MLSYKKSWSDAPNGNYWEQDEELHIQFQLGMICCGDDGGSDNDSGPSSSEVSDMQDAAAAAAQAAVDEAYGNNKGVTDGNGNAVTDGFGNAVKSGGYNRSYDDAFNSSMNDSYQAFAEEQFNANNQALIDQGKTVGQNYIDVAMGQGGFLTNFDPENPMALNVANPAVSIGPASLDQLNSYGNQLGTYAQQRDYAFPGASFNDPFGTGMSDNTATLAGDSGVGSKYTDQNEANYFNAFSDGYNDSSGMFGTNLSAVEGGDYDGAVGMNTFGQRAGDAIGGAMLGLIGGAVAGPLGSAIGNAFDTQTQTPYGNFIGNLDNPYASQGTAYSTFGPGNLLGGLAQGASAKAIGGVVGPALMEATGGNKMQALAGTMGAAGLGSKAVGNAVTDMVNQVAPTFSVGSGASDMPSSVELQAQEEGGSGGGGSDSGGDIGTFSQSLGPQGGGSGSNSTTNQGVSMDNVLNGGNINAPGGSIYSDPVVANDPIADYLGAAITGQPAGVVNPSAGDQLFNPLMMADASTGVQYLTSGRNRDYGSGTTNQQSRNDFMKNDRRSRITGGFGRRADNGVLFG